MAPLFPTAALTVNQRAAATGLDDLNQDIATDAGRVYRQILFMTAPQAQAAFDASSGEIYATLIADNLGAGMARSQRLVARSHESTGEGWGIWGGVNGRTGTIDGDGNAAEADYTSYGLDLGIDYRGPDNLWALGLSGGYTNADLDVDGRLSAATSEGYHIGAYGRYGTNGPGFTATAAFDYGSAQAHVSRRIVFGTIDRTTFANVDTDTVAVSGELRYGLPLSGAWSAGPVALIHYADTELGHIGETGASSLDLSGDGNDETSTRYGGGGFINWQSGRGSLDASAQYITGNSRLSWATLSLESAPQTRFTVFSPRVSGDAGLFTLSGNYELGGRWTLGAEARGTIAAQEQSVAGSVSLGWKF